MTRSICQDNGVLHLHAMPCFMLCYAWPICQDGTEGGTHSVGLRYQIFGGDTRIYIYIYATSRSWGLLERLTVTQIRNSISLISCNKDISFSVQKDPLLTSILRQKNHIQNLTPFTFHTYFDINLPLICFCSTHPESILIRLTIWWR